MEWRVSSMCQSWKKTIGQFSNAFHTVPTWITWEWFNRTILSRFNKSLEQLMPKNQKCIIKNSQNIWIKWHYDTNLAVCCVLTLHIQPEHIQYLHERIVPPWAAWVWSSISACCLHKDSFHIPLHISLIFPFLGRILLRFSLCVKHTSHQTAFQRLSLCVTVQRHIAWYTMCKRVPKTPSDGQNWGFLHKRLWLRYQLRTRWFVQMYCLTVHGIMSETKGIASVLLIWYEIFNLSIQYLSHSFFRIAWVLEPIPAAIRAKGGETSWTVHSRANTHIHT